MNKVSAACSCVIDVVTLAQQHIKRLSMSKKSQQADKHMQANFQRASCMWQPASCPLLLNVPRMWRTMHLHMTQHQKAIFW